MSAPLQRWCDGPCGRLLPLTVRYFVPTGPVHVTKGRIGPAGIRRRYLTHKCRRCRAVRKQERDKLPTVKARLRVRWRRYHAAHRAERNAYMRAWKLRTGYRDKRRRAA